MCAEKGKKSLKTWIILYLLNVTTETVRSDVSEIDSGSKIGSVNLFFQPLFGQLDILLNDRTISDGIVSYLYRAYLESLFELGR